jgi:RNA recognition motif-containing protein
MTTKLHVGNLETSTTKATLLEAFQRAGRPVLSVEVVMSREAMVSRGFAFVETASEEEALAAVQALHGAEIDGRKVSVSLAHPPKSRFGGSRRP